jgi:hypothetical protein
MYCYYATRAGHLAFMPTSSEKIMDRCFWSWILGRLLAKNRWRRSSKYLLDALKPLGKLGVNSTI